MNRSLFSKQISVPSKNGKKKKAKKNTKRKGRSKKVS